MKKRILIITANFYPILGPRAHRSTELAKGLAKNGHEVIVYTLCGKYDYTEFENTHKVKVRDLGSSDSGLLHNDGYINLSIINRIKIKLFKKYLQYPFILLLFKTYKVLKKETNYDTLITIAHPHTIHWGAGMFFKKYSKRCTWIADCGDPFMNNPFNKYPIYFKYFEHSWCKLVDYITIPVEEAKGGYYEQYLNKIKIIPQGFQMESIMRAEYSKNSIPTFAYSGVFYKDFRDPTSFLKYLSTLDIDFKFIVYTKSNNFLQPFIDVLGSKLEIRDYVPRDELIFELSKMDFLINIINESSVQQPSKLIDYYLTNRPIIDITSKFNQIENFENYLKFNFIKAHNYRDIRQYDIINVVSNFEQLFYEN
ncbi:hypothetical protein OBK27_04805 [Empedobacter falsenii]